MVIEGVRGKLLKGQVGFIMEVKEASLAMSNQAKRILDQDCKVHFPLTKTR